MDRTGRSSDLQRIGQLSSGARKPCLQYCGRGRARRKDELHSAGVGSAAATRGRMVAVETASEARRKTAIRSSILPRGFFYKNRVDLYEVTNGRAVPIRYRRDDFSFAQGIPQWPDVDLGFAGFRIHAPISNPDYYDEGLRLPRRKLLSGRSPREKPTDCPPAGFPSIRRDEGRGISAVQSILAEEACANATSIVCSCPAGQQERGASYRFTIRPGETTVFDVEMSLYPRVDLEHAALLR